jgi:hypothetical protein
VSVAGPGRSAGGTGWVNARPIQPPRLGAGTWSLSWHRFLANQVHLLLHAAAYALLDTLRAWRVAASNAQLTLETMRLRLIKIGGRVRQLPKRVHLRLASSHPGEPLWLLLAAHWGRS